MAHIDDYHSEMPGGTLAKLTAWILMSGVKSPLSSIEYLRILNFGSMGTHKWITGSFILVHNKATVIYPMHRDIRDLPFILGKTLEVTHIAHINIGYSWSLMQRIVPLNRVIKRDKGIV